MCSQVKDVSCFFGTEGKKKIAAWGEHAATRLVVLESVASHKEDEGWPDPQMPVRWGWGADKPERREDRAVRQRLKYGGPMCSPKG